MGGYFGIYLHFDILADIGVDGSLGGFDEGFQEWVRGFVEEEGEADVHPGDAQVVFHHPNLHDVLARAGVAHGLQGVYDELWVESHVEGKVKS